MYCSNCGEKRNDTGGFCSHCGKQQNGSTSNRKESSSFTHSFSSKLILGGNLLRPDRLVLDQD